MYVNKLDDVVNEYNNTYHRTIKMEPVHIKDNTYIDSMELHSIKEVNDKDPKFKVGNHVRIFKYKLIKKVKNTVPWPYVVNDLNNDEIIGTFYEKELQKTNQKEFRIEKVIKIKTHKLNVKWKGYDSSFNSWIDKKDLIK